MTRRTIPPQYFKNRREQASIKIALTEAMPVGVYYHNLIIALAELLERAVMASVEDELYTKWHDDPEICPKCGSDLGHRINCPDGIAFTGKPCP